MYTIIRNKLQDYIKTWATAPWEVYCQISGDFVASCLIFAFLVSEGLEDLRLVKNGSNLYVVGCAMK